MEASINQLHNHLTEVLGTSQEKKELERLVLAAWSLADARQAQYLIQVMVDVPSTAWINVVAQSNDSPSEPSSRELLLLQSRVYESIASECANSHPDGDLDHIRD